MATDLRDRLGDLAAHTPPGAPPADLWDRGVRRRRAERAGSAVLVAVLVVLLGSAGLAWRSDRSHVAPVAPQGAVRFPDRFYAPGPWLPTFDGPPGPLVAILPAEQKSLFHTREGVVGVTAHGNEYGFLDLPSSAIARTGDSVGLALSPHGSQVAFWVTAGRTTGRPNTNMEGGVTVTGVGTYDTMTGRTRVEQVPSVHGLEASLLMWTDDSTLVFGYGRIHNDGSGGSSHATYAGTFVWDAGTPRPVELPAGWGPGYPDAWSSGAAGGRLVTSGVGRRWWLLDPHSPQSLRRFAVERPARMPVLSEDLTEIAGVEQHAVDNGWYRLLVADLPQRSSDGPAVFRRVPAGQQWLATAGWADGDLVAMRRLRGTGLLSTGDVMAELDRIDVTTGSYTKLADVELGADVADPYSELLARSYLDAPVVRAAPPPHPWGERWLVLLGGLGLLAALGLWRLRARRA